MSFQRRRLIAAIVLAGALAAGLTWLVRLDFSRAVSTDVLDLLPPGEQAPELALVRSLASEREARTMLLLLADREGEPAPLEQTQRFVEALRRSGAFVEAIALGDPSWRDAAGRTLFALRFPLLLPGWLARHEGAPRAEGVADELRAFLERPEALAYQDLIAADPLLLVPGALHQLRGTLAGLQPGAGEPDRMSGLVWARLAASPLSEAGQGPAFAAIATAAKEIGAVVSMPGEKEAATGLSVAYTGVNRFAAASRARIEAEVAWLNTLSLVAVLGVAVAFVRAVHRALHLAPVIGFSLLGAWVATTLVFERVHVIVFVLGALLAGVAIDYGFYLFMQPPARPDETYPEKVRRLAKPLLASCATTVAGFALLLFSDLPLLRQLGVFVGAGLVSALIAAVLYFALWRDTYLAPRDFPFGGQIGAPGRRRLRGVVIAIWIVSVAGLARIEWRDDIRQLEVPAPELQAEDARIRAAFGHGTERAVLLTQGRTLSDAREALARLEAWAAGKTTLAHLGPLVPTAAEWERTRAFLRERPRFADELRTALAAEGFEADAFEPFFEALRRFATDTSDEARERAVTELHRSLTGPLALLLHVSADRCWFVSLAHPAPPVALPADANTAAASQLQSLNRIFAEYRRSALQLSLAGLALVGLGVVLTYGVRDGGRIFAIPCGTCLGVFGVFGWIGQPLNLFHLLGAFLGVCLTHNYSIFSATSVYRGESPPPSVRLSALTTGASFAVLGFSNIPVVHALGVTVAAMVFGALLTIEFEHLAPLRKAEAT